MAIQIECPKCGSMHWVVIGYTKPLLISELRCAVCWYEEKYAQPKDADICPGCGIPHNPKIGIEEPKEYNLYAKKCPKCDNQLAFYWDKRKEKLEIKCPKCYWRKDGLK